jgi:hypothetical protein
MTTTATITTRFVETVEYGPMAFVPGETVEVIAVAVAGTAKTLVRCEAGLTFHLVSDYVIDI